MRQTEQTAIVLRSEAYRDNDRMLTLFSPTRGKIEALCRGCRRPRSPLLPASREFALGDWEIYDHGGHTSVTGISLIENFYPLWENFERQACGVYLLNLTEQAIQPGQGDQELFMLLLHTLSRLTFSNQEWKPLLAGFLLHYAAGQGWKPRLNHCVCCGRRLEEREPVFFDIPGGGLCCGACRDPRHLPVSPEQTLWMRTMLQTGSSGWVNREDCYAPFALLKDYVESRLDRPPRSARMLPRD